jgi:thiopurine S-methyltransferase
MKHKANRNAQLSNQRFNDSWKKKWQRNDIAFHQNGINPLLREYLPQLNLSAGDFILVPLCGKSLDMDWLTHYGLRVIGIELSSVAIQAYFDARQVKPQQKVHGRFTRWWHQQTEIWCGDIFDLSLRDMHRVKSIYDCAALTALPATLRINYVQHFLHILPRDSQILLMTTETPDINVINSVHTIDSEVSALYQADYRIQLLHGKNCFKIDPEYPQEPECNLEEKVYLMNTPLLM